MYHKKHFPHSKSWLTKKASSKGIIKKANLPVKVLGNGNVTKKLEVKLNAYSASAAEKITAAGGKAEVI